MAKRKLTPEGAIKAHVKYYLKLKGWFIFPIMQGPLSYRGISDFYAIKGGRGIWMEIKTPKGRQSDYQIQFQYDIESHGGEYLIVKDVQELIDAGI